MGTIVNSIAILLGGLAGLIFRRGIPQRVEETAMKLLGLAVFIVGLEGVLSSMASLQDGVLSFNGSLLLIASMVIGGVLGELWDIDARLMRCGKRIEGRLGQAGFAKGFVGASLVFCIGAMAIVGALNDGLYGDPSTLYTKAMLDCVGAVVMASALGYGVLFSALPVLVYQGGITLFAGLLGPFLTGEVRSSICMVGYAVVLCIGINFLGAAKLPTANLLPALAVPILYHLLLPALTRAVEDLF